MTLIGLCSFYGSPVMLALLFFKGAGDLSEPPCGFGDQRS